MEQEKTHYREAFNGPYLSSSDIDVSIVLTVDNVILEPDKTNRTKEKFNTAYFKENEISPGRKMKPMILNSGNTEIVRKFAGGSKWIEDWSFPFPVKIYVTDKVKFGSDVVSGLRVAKEPPVLTKPELKPNTKAWENAMAAYKRDGNFDAIEQRVSVSDINKQLIIKDLADAVA